MLQDIIGRRYAATLWLAVLLAAVALPSPGAFAQAAGGDQSFEVMREFTEQDRTAGEIEEQRKHQILFYMGAVLLVSIITTAWLGISMVIFGKQVFVAHMIFAGISVSLSIVHAVTAIVWFFPF